MNCLKAGSDRPYYLVPESIQRIGRIALPKPSKNQAKRMKRSAKERDRLNRIGFIPFHDPVASISDQIHARSFSARSPKMFDLADQLPPGEDRDGAAHECGIALRIHAGIPQFAKCSESTWQCAVDDFTKG